MPSTGAAWRRANVSGLPGSCRSSSVNSSDESLMNQDCVDLLRAFSAADVRYLVVGASNLSWKDWNMALLDWSQCPAVESVPGKVSGAWVFKNTRTPVAIVFENLEDGMSIDEVVEQFPVTPDQVRAVLEFAARSLDVPA
jgi:uncharacterized protein (DUF433 family)